MGLTQGHVPAEDPSTLSKRSQRRRRAAGRGVVLPAGGRRGRTPKWPLDGPDPHELAVWRDLWRTPQAHAWERLGYTRDLALLARFRARLEDGGPGWLALEVRQREDRFGLNPLAMRRLGWTIAEDEVAEQRKAAPRRGQATRDRLRRV